MKDVFEVDGAKCVKCGACVRDCAFGALKMADGAPRMAFPDRCMKCQHCLAVCPAGALTCDGYSPDRCVPAGPLPDESRMMNLIRQRRSIRQFKQENLPSEIME